MALTQTHEALELWVEVLTVGGIIGTGIITVATFSFKGWIRSASKDKEMLEDRINDALVNIKELKEESHNVWEKQWQRVDEVKIKAENFVTRDHHDADIKEMYISIEKAVYAGIRPLTESFNRLYEEVHKYLPK